MLALRLISAMRKHVGPFTLPVAFIVLTLINYVDKNNHPSRQIKVDDDNVDLRDVEWISNSSAEFKCEHKGCNWKNYQIHDDWGIYTKGNKETVNCAKCQVLCANDPNCGAVECDEDKTGVAYCSWWALGKCSTESERNTNNASFFTCYKQFRKIINQ